jgi:hypothetical protein
MSTDTLAANAPASPKSDDGITTAEQSAAFDYREAYTGLETEIRDLLRMAEVAAFYAHEVPWLCPLAGESSRIINRVLFMIGRIGEYGHGLGKNLRRRVSAPRGSALMNAPASKEKDAGHTDKNYQCRLLEVGGHVHDLVVWAALLDKVVEDLDSMPSMSEREMNVAGGALNLVNDGLKAAIESLEKTYEAART